MRRFWTVHPSDDAILRMLDGETVPHRLRDHCRRCPSCGRRRDLLEEAVGTYRAAAEEQNLPTEALVQLRRRLVLAMEEGTAGPSWSPGETGRSFSLPTARLAGSMVVLAAMVIAAWWWAALLVNRSPAQEAAWLPVPALTPGAVETIAVADLCAGRFPRHPPVPAHVRAAVLRDYRMEDVPPDAYELDYLITPELGGSDDRRNLWPELYESGTWHARVKDELEELLPALVCQGKVNLETAQREIASDWIKAYKKYFQTAVPVRAGASFIRLSFALPGSIG